MTSAASPPRPLSDALLPPGAPALARQAADLLTDAGLTAALDPSRGLDHGAWIPLMLRYPEATIPVLQVSIQPDLGPAHHLAVGRALAALRAQDVLVIGSGSYTHDLSHFHREMEAPAPPDVIAFADWFDAAVTQRRIDDLLHYRTRAPHAAEQHPTDEHLLPLYIAMGAGSDPTRIHTAMNSVLRMDAYAFA